MVLIDVTGYTFCSIKKSDLGKKEFLSDIEKIEPKIKEKITKILNNGGKIYGLKKRRKLKVVYLFDAVEQNEQKGLVFEQSIYTENVKDAKIKECEIAIRQILQEEVNKNNYIGVKWNNLKIAFNKKENFFALMFPICLLIGAMVGYAFSHVVTGCAIGTFVGLFLISFSKI